MLRYFLLIAFLTLIFSGGFQDKETVPKHDTVPNMKLVMNPEGENADYSPPV